jgi:DNA polymerase III epsilon subunit-like protein
MSVLDWVIIDTETTGISAPIYAVEIAAQRMRGLEPVDKSFRVFLNHEVDMPLGAQRIHGYSRAFLARNGVNPLDAHRGFMRYVGDAVLSAYNLPYDYDKVLLPEWKRLGITTPLARGFCMLRLTRTLIGSSPAGDFKLQTLREHYRLPERDAHSALGDVQTVVDLLKSVLSPRMRKDGLIDPGAIVRFLGGESYPDYLPFGKHKGRHWKEAVVDREMLGWLQWLAREGDQSSSKRAYPVNADTHYM